MVGREPVAPGMGGDVRDPERTPGLDDQAQQPMTLGQRADPLALARWSRSSRTARGRRRRRRSPGRRTPPGRARASGRRSAGGPDRPTGRRRSRGSPRRGRRAGRRSVRRSRSTRPCRGPAPRPGAPRGRASSVGEVARRLRAARRHRARPARPAGGRGPRPARPRVSAARRGPVGGSRRLPDAEPERRDRIDVEVDPGADQAGPLERPAMTSRSALSWVGPGSRCQSARAARSSSTRSAGADGPRRRTFAHHVSLAARTGRFCRPAREDGPEVPTAPSGRTGRLPAMDTSVSHDPLLPVTVDRPVRGRPRPAHPRAACRGAGSCAARPSPAAVSSPRRSPRARRPAPRPGPMAPVTKARSRARRPRRAAPQPRRPRRRGQPGAGLAAASAAPSPAASAGAARGRSRPAGPTTTSMPGTRPPLHRQPGAGASRTSTARWCSPSLPRSSARPTATPSSGEAGLHPGRDAARPPGPPEPLKPKRSATSRSST